MTELHVPTSRRGSPFAAELDRRLKSDEPLTSVVDWWRTAFRAWREPQLSAGADAPAMRLA
jgi:hypothetical protein